MAEFTRYCCSQMTAQIPAAQCPVHACLCWSEQGLGPAQSGTLHWLGALQYQ